MPPIPAAHMAMILKAALYFVAFGLTIMAAVKSVGFADDYHNRPTQSSITSLHHSLAVKLQPGSGSEPCPTCLFIGSDDGRLIDVQQLSSEAPTPTIPLKVSFAAPSTLHPEQTPNPQTTSKAILESKLTTTEMVSSLFSQQILPPPGASKLQIILVWCQNLFRYIGEIVNTTSVSILRAIKQQAWGIACGIMGTVSVAATVNTFLPRLNFWNSHWTMGKDLGKVTSSQTKAQLATKANRLLKKIMAIVHENFPDSNTMMSAVQRILVEYVNGTEAHIEKTLAKEKAWLNATLKATYERDVFAAANIEPSFGPSLRNAEVELRNRLGGATIEEGVREDIIGIFKGILYSFTYAISVEESGPGGRNTRYLSFIDGQNHLIECLRLLHKHREDAYAENEDLVRSLCRYDVDNKLIIPYGEEERDPWDKYSARDYKFILSPLDGPTALSMKVSLSAPPLQGRLDANLELDPHWQRFLDSVARKEAEQDARHASAVREPIKEKAETHSGIEDAGVQEHDDTSRIDDGGYPGPGVNIASEQTHHDTPRDDETIPSAAAPNGLSEDDLESSPEGDNDIVSAIHEDAESSQKECRDQKGESILYQKRCSKLIMCSGPMDHSFDGQLDTAKSTLSCVQWQIRYLRSGHGTPEDPYARPLSEIPPTTAIEETGDAALARKFQEEEYTLWRKEKIESYERQVERLSASIVSLEAARGQSKTAKRALERKTAKNKAKEAGEVGVPKPKPEPEPEPEPEPTKAEEDAEARQ